MIGSVRPATTIDDVVATIDALGPAATLLAAIIAGAIATGSLVQRTNADKRAEWWRRAQWALEQHLSDSEARRTIGYKTLTGLGDSRLATKDDLRLYAAAFDDALSGVPQDGDIYLMDNGEGTEP